MDQNQKIDQIAVQITRKQGLLINKTISVINIRKYSDNIITRCEAELKELSRRVNEDLDIVGLADLAVKNLNIEFDLS